MTERFLSYVLLFWIAGSLRGAIAVDVNTSVDATTAGATVTSSAISTTVGNELFLAFISTDYQSGPNTTVKSVSGAGLNWVLVLRANTQSGTSEIWRTFAPTPLNKATVTATLSQSVVSSMTVMSFAGVDTSGTSGSGAIGAVAGNSASSGAPFSSLTTTRNNSWVFGVGNDFDKAILRTPGAGQSVVHQYLSPLGDTYWVQQLNSSTPSSGTSVTLNDTAPTTDSYNLAICEILPALVGGTTWSISGTISPTAGGSGAIVTLTGGTGSATTTADVSGNYAFTNLPNGTYTVTPTASGYTFNPPSQTVTVNGANQVGINFTAQAVQTTNVRLVQSNVNGSESTAQTLSIAFPSSNASGNLLIVTGTVARPSGSLSVSDTANNTFAAALGPFTDPVQDVSVYIWYASNCKGGPNAVTITSSIPGALELHISEWSGVASASPLDQASVATGNGATVSSGSRTTTIGGELIFGYSWVLNNASAGSGFTPLTFVNGDLAEYQIQPAAGPISATFNQTSGAWLAAMATFRPAGGWSISGTIGPAPLGAGVTVTLSGAASSNVMTDASGNYSFTGLGNGTYSVTPAKDGYIFSPANQSVTINAASSPAVNFAAQAAQTWSISGMISPTAAGSGATISLTGTASMIVTADASGSFAFAGLGNGTYTVTPSKNGFTFNPANKFLTISGASQTGVSFTGTPLSISGTISPAAGGAGATVTLGGAATLTVIADSNGAYTFSQLAAGSYVITPTKNGYMFNPASQSVTIGDTSASGINFTAVAPSNSITQDANTSKDGATPNTTITTPAFTTSANNELLLAFIATDYLGGPNTTVQSVTGGGLTWALAVRTNVQSGSSEIWRAFSPVPLSNVTVSANLSQSVVSTITVMSFSGVDSSGTGGSGAIGATGSSNASSGAPAATLVTTRNNSWILGVGNDFDNAIPRTLGPGQNLVHQYLSPTGDTYWVQMKSSPVPASGTSVTINDTAPASDRYNFSVVEILAGSGGVVDSTPPTVSMTSPAQGATLASLATVSAIASDDTAVVGVQFLLDGSALGAEITAPPYTMTWNTTTTTNGSHTLAAKARDTVGLTTTSTAVTVTVDNSGNVSTIGSWSSVIPLPAVAVNLVLLQNNKVLFYQDGSTPTVWDYVNNTFTNIPGPADLFCSGHALLSDGRVLVVGGFGQSSNSIGISNAEIFDPSANTWTSVPNMSYRRWYPGATTLSDGRVLVTAGWQSSAHTNAGISEIYDPVANSWTQLTNANNPFETYPFMYLLPDGRVIHIGGSEYATDTDVLDLNTKTWSVIDSNIVDGGSATMYTPNKFMKAGSASDSQNTGPSSNTTFVLDMTQAAPAWRQTPSMAYARTFFNLTTLPDGSVLATGGETDKNGGNIANAVYAAELWSPQTQTWSLMASMHTPREYHGTALLLPDARVLVSGMGADFGNVPDQKSAEFYSPPYLFKGARPTISQSPAHVPYASNFFVGTPDGASIASVALIRSGAVTHAFDQNARYIPLSFQQASGGLTVTAPANANLAPPGYYMLFIVNSSGVPSIAPFVKLP